MDEQFKIPGLLWEGLSTQQEKLQQNFVAQELARYKTKTNYLARLQNLKIQPTPAPGKINPLDPCDNGVMIKLECNKKEKTQERGHKTKIAIISEIPVTSPG